MNKLFIALKYVFSLKKNGKKVLRFLTNQLCENPHIYPQKRYPESGSSPLGKTLHLIFSSGYKNPDQVQHTTTKPKPKQL